MFFDRDFGGGGRRPFPSMDRDPAFQGRFPGFSARDRSMPGFDEFANRHPMFGRNSPFDEHFENGFPTRERTNSGNSSGSSGKNGSATTTGKEHVIPIKVIHTKSESEPHQNNMPHPSAPESESAQTAPVDALDKGKKQTYSQQRNTSEIPHSKVNESNIQRNQRAQSAPPGTETESLGRPPQVNPSNESINTKQYGGKTSKSQETTSNGVRNIPIFVEGRKGPVVNGNAKKPDPVVKEQRNHQPHNESKSSRSTPEEVAPPKKQALPKSQLELIQEVLDDVNALAEKVEAFTGTFKDKDYIYLDEMLTRDLIKLDLIETEGREDIRLARKNCIKEIQNTIAKLETKVKPPTAANEQEEVATDSMEVEEVKTEQNAEGTDEASIPEVINANAEVTAEPREQSADSKMDVSLPQEPCKETVEGLMETDLNNETSSASENTTTKPENSHTK